MMSRLVAVLGLLLFWSAHACADRVGYSGTHEITAEGSGLVFHHVHNWSSPKVQVLFFDLAHHDRFFSPDNDFSYVELREKSGKMLFRSPSPALTHLWISPDSQFLVGLSSIMLHNPYQFVVWRRDGTIAHREHIAAEVAKLSAEQRRDFARDYPKAAHFLDSRSFAYGGDTYLDFMVLGIINKIGEPAWGYLYSHIVPHPYSDDFRESVTNSVEWFDAEHPGLAIAMHGKDLALSLRSPQGHAMAIPLTK